MGMNVFTPTDQHSTKAFWVIFVGSLVFAPLFLFLFAKFYELRLRIVRHA